MRTGRCFVTDDCFSYMKRYEENLRYFLLLVIVGDATGLG